jgi:hypothetical protein
MPKGNETGPIGAPLIEFIEEEDLIRYLDDVRGIPNVDPADVIEALFESENDVELFDKLFKIAVSADLRKLKRRPIRELPIDECISTLEKVPRYRSESKLGKLVLGISQNFTSYLPVYPSSYKNIFGIST